MTAPMAQPPRKILLVGEGDFTFALALKLALPEIDLTATGFDALDDVRRTYQDAPFTLAKLEKAGAAILHGVDATRLESFCGFDEVVFSHPHLGVEDCPAHHRLLAHYFAAARAVAPVVRVTLAASQASLWRCDAAAARCGLRLARRDPFLDDRLPGYTRRRSLRGATFRHRTPRASATRAYASPGVVVLPVAWAGLPRAAADARCPRCGRRCRDARAYATHWKDAHGGPPEEACVLVDDDDEEEEDDVGDEAPVEDDPPGPGGSCAVCGIAFESAEAAAAHARSLAPARPAGVACACGRAFGGARALAQHAASGTCAAARRRVRVLYCHGLEAGPGGYKARKCREWADVLAPDMAVSLWHPLRENSFARRFLAAVWNRDAAPRRRAAADALGGCARAVAAAAAAAPACDALLASSWGAVVALRLLADGAWAGPAVLLCPAVYVLLHADDADALVARVAALPAHKRRQLTLMHGDADATVPLADSRRLAAATGIALVELPGGTHGLGRHATDGTIFAALLANLRNARAARPGAKRDGRPLADAFLLDGLPPGVSC